jgi:glucan 1,3-beta-glucosidase
MKAHWDTWYTEEHIKNLSTRGIEMVRLPIGDWTLDPYGPYVGCMDGAKEKIDWFLDTAHKYNISVLIDVHGAIGSQNGGMSSGYTGYVEWLSETNYTHWNHPKADWLGDWNLTTQKYDNINWKHLDWSLDQMEGLLKLYG